MIYNIVEDVRIEHAWGEIYIGSKFRFKHLARNIINHKPTNAFDVLFSIRANRLDYIPKEYEELTHQFQKLLKEVEGKSPGMTLTISQEIIKIMADDESLVKKEQHSNGLAGWAHPRGVQGLEPGVQDRRALQSRGQTIRGGRL